MDTYLMPLHTENNNVMYKKQTHIYLTLLILAALLPVRAQEVQPTWESLNQRGYPQWSKMPN